MNLPERKTIKYGRKNNKINYSHLVIYLYIPVIPWHGYVVMCRYAKSGTVPIPAKPVTLNLRVFPYLWHTLSAWDARSIYSSAIKSKWGGLTPLLDYQFIQGLICCFRKLSLHYFSRVLRATLFQWNLFQSTQIIPVRSHPISPEKAMALSYWACSDWTCENKHLNSISLFNLHSKVEINAVECQRVRSSSP